MQSMGFLLCIPYNELIDWHDDRMSQISGLCTHEHLIDIICLTALNNDISDLSQYSDLILTLLYRRRVGEVSENVEDMFVNYILSKTPIILNKLPKIPNYQDSFKSIVKDGLIYIYLKVNHGNAHMHV